ncbi:MAG: hypothetical protein EPGJADBJ_04420 [Saprospiraceae bacterium]|nr:hypothetical protein [Saprospiraceae bacterium]
MRRRIAFGPDDPGRHACRRCVLGHRRYGHELQRCCGFDQYRHLYLHGRQRLQQFLYVRYYGLCVAVSDLPRQPIGVRRRIAFGPDDPGRHACRRCVLGHRRYGHELQRCCGFDQYRHLYLHGRQRLQQFLYVRYYGLCVAVSDLPRQPIGLHNSTATGPDHLGCDTFRWRLFGYRRYGYHVQCC